MPSPAGWREVPCVECGEFVAGIDFGERCRACQRRRMVRAQRLASRIALISAALAGAWAVFGFPRTPNTRWWAALAIGATYGLVYFITRRMAMEALR